MRERRRRFHLPAATSAMLALAVGFAVLIVVGTVLLSAPGASTGAGSAPFIVTLFTATSAACVTGLVVVDSATYWTGFGQAVLAGLMFLGGLGIMTSGTVLLIAIGRRITLNDRLVLRESMGASSLGSVTSVGRQIVIFAVAVQLVGFAVLTTRFLIAAPDGSVPWHGLFLAVSAFNNAGLNILPGSDSLAAYSGDMFIVGAVGLLIVLGSVSLPVLVDLWRHRRMQRWSLDTRMLLVGMLGLWLLGALAMFAFEFNNAATLGAMPLGDKVASVAFQAVTARTAGFSTVDFGATRGATDVVFMVLMFVGGASGSTAGGIKINTMMVLAIAAYASVRGRPRPEAFKRELPYAQVARAMAIVVLALVVLMALVMALALTEGAKLEAGTFEFLDVLFEATSAFGTTGLSRGITSELSDPGRVVLTIGMYLGRLGPLTIALGLALRERRAVYRFAEERVRIG